MRSRGVLCCFLLFCSFHDAHAECGLDARARIDGEKKESVCKEAVKALQTVFQHKTPDKVGDSAALEMVCPIMQMEALADDSSGQCLQSFSVLIRDGALGDTAVPLADEALQYQPCHGEVQILSPGFESGRRPKFQPVETPAPPEQRACPHPEYFFSCVPSPGHGPRAPTPAPPGFSEHRIERLHFFPPKDLLSRAVRSDCTMPETDSSA